MTYETRKLLDDPSVSYWLKSAVQKLMDRDICDAMRDVEILRDVMTRECKAIMGR